MAKTLCGDMKAHSFFLLVNYLSSIAFSLMLQALLYQNLLETPRVAVRALLTIIIIMTVVFLVANLTAFLHYVFGDDVHSSFHKFYIMYQIVYSGVSLLLVISLLIYSFFTVRKIEVLIFVILYSIVAIIALAMLFFFSLDLKRLIYEEVDENLVVAKPEIYNSNTKHAFVGNEAKIDQELENQVKQELSQI